MSIDRRRVVVFSLTFLRLFLIRLFVYLTVHFLLTLSYALYHAARKTLSGVKSSISKDWLNTGSYERRHEVCILPV